MARWLVAFLLSFVVYLVPIVHVHGGTLLGIYLWAALDGGRADEPLWLALDVGFAVLLQAAWFFVLRWILRGSRLRWLLLAALAPVTAVAAVWAYLALIPMLFLLEADTAPETGDWPVACSVPGVSTVGLPAGVTLALERAGEVWVRSADGSYGVLSMPGCRIVRRDLFLPGVYGSIGYVAPGGAVYFRMDADADGAFEHWYLDSDATAPRQLMAPTEIAHWTPVLDAKTKALAWLEIDRSQRGKILGHAIVVRTLPDGPQNRFPLHIDPTANAQLLDADLAAGRLNVLRNYREIFAVGLDGWAVEHPVRPTEIDHVVTNFRRAEGGWVAWDGYRENERYRVTWSLPSGNGRYEIPKGRGITAVSVDPAGRHIALSVSGNLSIGSARDAVIVIRAADGAEVWRRYQPRYTRSHVAFLGSRHLAVTLILDAASRVDVLEVPAG